MTGLLRPQAPHNQYRRRGLAYAVIQECLRRLKDIGIERVYITGYGPGANALYEKLGPCQRKEWFHYERRFAESGADKPR